MATTQTIRFQPPNQLNQNAPSSESMNRLSPLKSPVKQRRIKRSTTENFESSSLDFSPPSSLNFLNTPPKSEITLSSLTDVSQQSPRRTKINPESSMSPLLKPLGLYESITSRLKRINRFHQEKFNSATRSNRSTKLKMHKVSKLREDLWKSSSPKSNPMLEKMREKRLRSDKYAGDQEERRITSQMNGYRKSYVIKSGMKFSPTNQEQFMKQVRFNI